MPRSIPRAREEAAVYFDRTTNQFLVVCVPHGVSYPAETTFDARLLVDLHNKAHADLSSDLYLPMAPQIETDLERRGRLLKKLREGLGLTVETAAALADVTSAQVTAAEEGRLDEGPIQMSLSTTYSTVAAGLSNARRGPSLH